MTTENYIVGKYFVTPVRRRDGGREPGLVGHVLTSTSTLGEDDQERIVLVVSYSMDGYCHDDVSLVPLEDLVGKRFYTDVDRAWEAAGLDRQEWLASRRRFEFEQKRLVAEEKERADVEACRHGPLPPAVAPGPPRHPAAIDAARTSGGSP